MDINSQKMDITMIGVFDCLLRGAFTTPLLLLTTQTNKKSVPSRIFCSL